MLKRLLPFVILFALSACLPDESGFDGFRRLELQRLLSNHSEKTWVLDYRLIDGEEVTFEMPTHPRRLIFKYTTSATDKDSLFYINRNVEYNSVNDTLKGFWYVPTTTTPQITTDSVVFVWQSVDTNHFAVKDINPDFFEITSLSDSPKLVEQFSSSSRK